MSPKQWKRPPRGVIDTSVLVAGVVGFRLDPPRTPSAVLLRDWCESPTFVWLVTDEILEEYLEVLTRLNVRGAGNIARLIGEEAEYVQVTTRISGLPHEEDAHLAECAGAGCIAGTKASGTCGLYDYADLQVVMLDRMFGRRCRA